MWGEHLLVDAWTPNLMYRLGIQAHNRGWSRDSSPVKDAKAVECFQRGWDKAKQVQSN